MPPTALDVRSSDKSKSNISSNAPKYDGESKGHKQARKRRNKLKEGHRHCARQRKEAWDTYEAELTEYNKKKSERKAKERHNQSTQSSLRQDMRGTRGTRSDLAS
jgi:hypothetical protein